jgi:hypothetical protein
MRAGTAISLLAAAVLAVGCASVDPTDPSHFTNVLVHNNTASAVQFIQCDTSCGTLHDREAIPAGGSTTINISNEGIPIGYLVERPSGLKLGCLYMRFDHVRTTSVVKISSLGRCH